jgi:hypothetical protein
MRMIVFLFFLKLQFEAKAQPLIVAAAIWALLPAHEGEGRVPAR